MNIENLDSLASWMRKVGAVRAYISKTVTELELGPEPQQHMAYTPTLTDAEIIREARINQERTDSYLFAASEGFPDEVDR